MQRISMHVGVLHFTPTSEPFPLLADAIAYTPNTIDINRESEELLYWAGVLQVCEGVVWCVRGCRGKGGGGLWVWSKAGVSWMRGVYPWQRGGTSMWIRVWIGLHEEDPLPRTK
jgi:hypothetical protein